MVSRSERLPRSSKQMLFYASDDEEQKAKNRLERLSDAKEIPLSGMVLHLYPNPVDQQPQACADASGAVPVDASSDSSSSSSDSEEMNEMEIGTCSP